MSGNETMLTSVKHRVVINDSGAESRKKYCRIINFSETKKFISIVRVAKGFFFLVIHQLKIVS